MNNEMIIMAALNHSERKNGFCSGKTALLEVGEFRKHL
jgi:hypothetical protein